MATGNSRLVIVVVSVALLAIGAAAAFASPIKRHVQTSQCRSRMMAICSAARLWACQHRGLGCLPRDLGALSTELETPELFQCPGDPEHPAAANWASFKPEQCSYEIVNPYARDGDTKAVFLRCKIHSHVGYADGFVFDGPRPRMDAP